MIKLRKTNFNCDRKNLDQELCDAIIAVRFLSKQIAHRLATVSGKGGSLNDHKKRIGTACR